MLDKYRFSFAQIEQKIVGIFVKH